MIPLTPGRRFIVFATVALAVILFTAPGVTPRPE